MVDLLSLHPRAHAGAPEDDTISVNAPDGVERMLPAHQVALVSLVLVGVSIAALLMA